jgi:hypothetical protein
MELTSRKAYQFEHIISTFLLKNHAISTGNRLDCWLAIASNIFVTKKHYFLLQNMIALRHAKY